MTALILAAAGAVFGLLTVRLWLLWQRHRASRRSTMTRQADGRYVKVARLGPPSLVQRLWYRMIREPVPMGVEATSRGDWMRLIPWQLRFVHRRFARRHGLFWLPCILCGRYSGGHQFAGSIPDPTQPGLSHGICPTCTRAGRSWRVPLPGEAELDAIHEAHEHGHDEWVLDCEACRRLDAAIRQFIDTFRKEQP